MRIQAIAAPVAALVLSLTACTTAQMRMPEGFETRSVVYDVSGHSPRRFNEPVRFGPFSALEMREGSTFAWRVPVAAADVGRTSKPYAYTLVARDLPPVEVQCRTRAWTAGTGRESRRVTVDLTALAGPLLACGLQLEGRDPQVLEVSRTGSRLQGRLEAPWGRTYTVDGVNGFEGSAITAMEPTGYAITDGGATLAVVDVLNGGRVHLDRALDEDQRVYFAATAAALLLLDSTLGE